MSIKAQDDKVDDPRRDFLLLAFRLGLFSGGIGWQPQLFADLLGKLPAKLPEGKSIFDIKGDVKVNGAPASKDTFVTASDTITTGDDSYVIVAVGDGAFIVREKSVFELGGKKLFVRAMRLVSGALLSVFGRRDDVDAVQITTPVATIGIRGTGFYTEAAADQTYFCTCYGVTNIASNVDPSDTETVKATHHDAPKYILAAPQNGKYIIPAPFKNHNDLELMTIEAIVGRQVPFAVTSKAYERPRRDEY